MDSWEAYEETGELDNGRAMPIAIPGEDGSLVVDLDAVESILLSDEIKNLPVSLISISGDFRTGKSFLLNTFLQWLNRSEKNGKVDDDWLLNATGGFSDGFHWRGGAELDTEGILMWSKPFIVKKREMKVAVLLIDTQGNFDQKSKRENNYQIFALSTLMSSVQNYNVSRQLQDNTFEHLQAFLTYARACETKESSPFQTLNFVVRDWPMPYQYQYGKDGGNQYLDQSWSPALIELDSKSGASIKGSFQRVDCYLLPFPGRAVNTCPKNDDLRVEDAEREFLCEIQALANKTFRGEDLIVKRIDGHIVTSGTLYEYMKKWKECLQSDRLPDIHTMTELIIENNCGNQMSIARSKFDDFLHQVEQGSFVEWEIFDEMAENAIIKCKLSFLDSTPFGRGTPLHATYVERLSANLNDRKSQIERKNGENQYRDLEEKCKNLLEEHRTALNQVDSWFTYGKDLDKAHDSVLTKLMRLKHAPKDPRCPSGLLPLFETYETKMENYLQSRKDKRNQFIKDTALTGAAITGSACAITGIILLAGPEILLAGTILVVVGQVANTALVITKFRRLTGWWRSTRGDERE